MHGDVLLKNMTEEPMTAHCGNMGIDTFTQFLRWFTKWRMKERILYRLKGTKWDGYYYIGLDDKDHEIIKNQKRIKHFRNVYLTKIKKENFFQKFSFLCFYFLFVSFFIFFAKYS